MKKDEFYFIVLDMRCTEKYMPTPQDVVSDDEIISRIEDITDLEKRDRDGRTLLINAAYHGRKTVIQYLLGRGADIHAKDAEEFTPLHASVIANDIECVKCLLEAGSDVNAKNMYGNHSIMMGNLATDLEIYKILMDYGADPEQKNNYGISAKDIYVCSEAIMKILNGEK